MSDSKQFYVFCAIFVLLGASIAIVGPLLSNMTDAGISESSLLLLRGAGAVAALLLQQLIGFRLGFHGSRKLLFALGTAYACLNLTDTGWHWQALFFAMGAIEALLVVAVNNLAASIARNPGSSLNVLNACFGVGALSAPLSLTLMTSELLLWSIAAGLVAISSFTVSGSDSVQPPKGSPGQDMSTQKLPQAVLLFGFLYACLELGFAHVATKWFSLTNQTDLVVQYGVALFWGSYTASRFFAGWILQRIAELSLMLGCSVIAAGAGALLLIPGIDQLTLLMLCALYGIACGPLMPTLFGWLSREGVLSERTASQYMLVANIGVLIFPAICWRIAIYDTTLYIQTLMMAAIVETGLIIVLYRNALRRQTISAES